MRRGAMLFVITILLVVCANACMAYSAGDPEFRGLFVDAWSAGIYDTAQINTLISTAQSMHVNTLIVQVRRRGDAFYASSYEPWARTVGFDSLAQLIQKAHACSPRIDILAWFVVWPIATSSPSSDSNHPYNKYPEYLTKAEDGTVLCGSNYWFDPGHPGAAQYTCDVIMDVVNRYDVDGINLDYIRYGGNLFGYNDVSVARFNAANGTTGTPSHSSSAWSNWRRKQVTDFVRKVYANAIAAKPNIKVTADTICGYPSPGSFTSSQAYYSDFQNWPAWMDEGILDMNMPMDYIDCDGAYAAHFNPWVCYSAANSYNRQNAVTVAEYSTDCMISQLASTRSLSCSGVTRSCTGASIYNYSGLTSAMRSTIAGVWSTPAAIPAMPWKTSPTSGHIKGNVTFGNTTWIDGASIVLTGPESRTMTADGTGFYAFIDLAPGTYNVSCTSSEYGTVSGSCVVTAGLVSSLDFNYAPSSVNISNIAVSNITASSATITWTTDAPASSKVFYGKDSTCSSSTVEDTSLTTSHSVTLSGLSSLTPYYFHVYSLNPSAPVAVSGTSVFVTILDRPVIVVDNSDSNAVFTGTWYTNTSTSAYNGNYKVSYLSGVQNATYTPNIPQTGNYEVSECHYAGTNRCTVAPHIINYNGGSTTVNVNQQINGSTAGSICWNSLGTYSFAAGTSANVVITNQGASGGSGALIADALKFTCILETNAPSNPTGLTSSSVADNYVKLAWTASTDDSAVAGYRISRGGTIIGASTTNSFTDSNVKPNTLYTYRVSAYDTSGNTSSESTPYTLYTYPIKCTPSTVTCNKALGVWHLSGPFVFTAVNGWGTGVAKLYRYVWDTSATHTWTGTETTWMSGTLSRSAASSADPYYLHIRAYNVSNNAGAPTDIGPFYVDGTVPPTPVVTDDGAYTTLRTAVNASWVADDPESTTVAYQIAVGTTSGGTDLLDWTDWSSNNASVPVSPRSYGSSTYVSVKAKNALGQWSSIGTSDGITIANPVESIVAAKALPDGGIILIAGRIVSAVYETCFYVQDPIVKSGIRCEGVCPYAVGTSVDVGGVLSTNSAKERVLANAGVTQSL